MSRSWLRKGLRALMTMTHSASMHESLSPIRWRDVHIVFHRSLAACRATCMLGSRSIQAPEPISKNGSRCWNQKTQLYIFKVPGFFSDPHLFLPHTTITKKFSRKPNAKKATTRTMKSRNKKTQLGFQKLRLRNIHNYRVLCHITQGATASPCESRVLLTFTQQVPATTSCVF